MKILSLAALALGACLAAGCASPSKGGAGPAAAAPAAGDTRVVKSMDGSFEGEIRGTPAPNSKFAKLKIGMSMAETQNILDRAPDRSHTYESGKRWIPFYFGNDARRMQVLFKGEGCLIFTGGNVWGGGAGDLIQIDADPSGACYQP
ncbi:MAG: hypothetical protein AB7P21_17975 [Lautropia sp.]